MSDPHFNGPLAHLIRRLAHHHASDPWSAEIDEAVRAKDAIPLCIDCLYPQEGGPRWFCPHCGYPVGDYVTSAPYLQIFAIAEVFRRGVMGPPEKSAWKQCGFVIFSLYHYSVFAPVYWYWMIAKAGGRPICEMRRPELPVDETSP